ncbi:MAG TPA: hypothetical protein VGR73_21705 [Bryobacteraceae bacterium]|nr:hypothetical protein [Bryobacteraceae bacterium]
MADFRKMFYALAIVALIACFTVPASAQSFQCKDNTATNQIARSEGWADYIGDILLGCTGGIPNGAGQQVKGADITVTLPQTQISSKIINPTAKTLLSEATLIMDDIHDPSSGAPTNFPGVRPHLVCADNGLAGGAGVCNVISDGNPLDTYDGSRGDNPRPNIFVARPNGANSVIFNGVPLDPPGTGFTRTIRITNIRINATVFDPSNPFAQVIAIIGFQGPAAVGLNSVQTQVAFVQKGMGKTTVTSDNTFLQCEYPTSIDSATGDDSDENIEVENHGWTADSQAKDAVLEFGVDGDIPNSGAVFPGMAISIKEGFQTAWKPRNMSELLGAGGVVVDKTDACNIDGNPCIDGVSNNSLSNLNIFAYIDNDGDCIVDGVALTCATNNPNDIGQNNPGTRFFTEGGFSEDGHEFYTSFNGGGSALVPYGPAAAGVCPGSGAPIVCKGAGFADYGTRIQFEIDTIPNGAVLSLPTIVPLANGGITSGVMVMTSVTGTGKGNFNPVAANSGLPAIQNAGYVDFTGTGNVVTYEVLFSDPFSTETANIYPVVYYPAGSLPSSVSMDLPQANVAATVTTATFAPWYATTGNQSTTPLGQVDGTPRFTHTTGSAPFSLFSINRCTCSLLFPWVVSDANYVTGIAVANTSKDPTNGLTPPVFGYTASQQQGTVQLYLFGTIGGLSAQTNTSIAAVYPAGDTLAKSGSYATFIVNTGFTGYAITQANFQYCHGLAFLFNATGAVPPVSYLGLTMDKGAKLSRTAQLVDDGMVH